ncbi:MAG: hypothetical protein MJZ78_08075 [Bacteroidales bacterium]|nr:hypothetical protein [Bacteroidales bacterium]
MKRTVITMMLACVAMFMTQCRKNDVQKPVGGETIDVTLVVGNGAKTEINAYGNVTWKQGDKIHIVGATTCYLGYVTAGNDGDPVRFSGTISYSPVTQVLHYYYVGSNVFSLDENGCYTFNVAKQEGTLATIADKLQLMYSNSGYAVPGGIVDLGSTTMTTKNAIGGFKFSRTDGAPFVSGVQVTGAYTAMKFNAKTADFEHAEKTGATDMIRVNNADMTADDVYYFSFIPGQQTLTFSQYVVFSEEIEKNIEENKLYMAESPIAMSVSSDVPQGALPGKFKVADDKYVYFSKGNLYYNENESTAKWGFENYQWDYRSHPQKGGWSRETGESAITTILYKNTNPELSSKGWGLFGYSTDKAGNYYGAMVSTTSADYNGNFVDWGIAYCESNGITPTTTWRTLERSELKYLNDATTHKTSYYASFKLNYGGVDYTFPGFAYIPSTIDADEMDVVKSDIKADLNKLASYGAVFFPITGRRYGDGQQESGYSYLCFKMDGACNFLTCGVGPSYSDGNFDYNGYVYIGGVVRLVYDVK